MKSILITLITSIVLLQCSSTNKGSIIHQDNYTNSDIEGQWSLSKVENIDKKQSISKYKAFIEKIKSC